MATLTLSIPDELDRELERQSAAAHQTKADLAREALQRYMRVAKFQAVRAQGVQESKASGVYTDEDVFQKLKKP